MFFLKQPFYNKERRRYFNFVKENYMYFFKGYAMDREGHYLEELYFKNELDCAKFIHLATKESSVHLVEIKDAEGKLIAKTFPRTPFIDYLDPNYLDVLGESIPYQRGAKITEDIDFTFLTTEEQLQLKQRLVDYQTKLNLDLTQYSCFSIE